MINCALVGFGRWGRVIYKSIQKNNFLNLKYICYNKTIKKNLIDKNIVITNYKQCKFFLLKGKNIFIEKPIVTDIPQIKEILILSKKLKLILHVNYIHIYNKNFIKFCEYFKKNYNINNKQQIFFKFGSDGPIRKNIKFWI